MGKHLNLSQRILIESNLNENTSLRKIGKMLEKPHTTISREILTRRILVKGNRFNNFNTKCTKTDKAPFVCNACPLKNKCKKNRYFYYAEDANNDYRKTLVEARTGIDFENDEFRKMDKIIKEEVDKGHSFYMIVLDHPEFNITERTLYYYQEKGYLSCKNIDLPRIVRYRKRKRKVSKNKSERKENECRINRTYDDFIKYKKANNINHYVEMDTVEGIKESIKVLLTIIIKDTKFMFIRLLDKKNVQSVNYQFDLFKSKLSIKLYSKVFRIVLTDNGSEFFDPLHIEYDYETGVKKTNVFYCKPYSSWQKGTIEKNHKYIRDIFPKGTSFDDMTTEQIQRLEDTINNIPRDSLDGKTPYELTLKKYPELIKSLNCSYISPDDVCLTKKAILGVNNEK